MYRNVDLYSSTDKLNFDEIFDEKEKQVIFDDLKPCTAYMFSIQASYKVPVVDRVEEGKTNHSVPSIIVAETLCPSDIEEHTDLNTIENEENYDITEDEASTTETYIPTMTLPDIQLVSDVSTQQTAMVLN